MFISNERLRGALLTAKPFLDRKSLIPAFENLKFILSKGTLVIMAGSTEGGVALKILDVTGDDTSFVVHPDIIKISASLPKQAPIEFVNIEEENRVSVICGSNSFSLPTIPVKDYPKMNFDDWKEVLRMDAKLFSEKIKSISPFVEYGGDPREIPAFIKRREDSVLFAGCSNLCMNFSLVSEGVEYSSDSLCISIPKIHIEKLSKVVNYGNVIISESGNFYRFTLPDKQAQVILIKSYNEIPETSVFETKEYQYSITVDANELLSAVKLSGIVSDEQTRTTKLIASDKGLEVKASQMSIGKESSIFIPYIDQKLPPDKRDWIFNSDVMEACINALFIDKEPIGDIEIGIFDINLMAIVAGNTRTLLALQAMA